MNLSLYTPEQEENLSIRKSAKTWQRSGFITKEQLKIIEEQTATPLAETPLFFRILYFVFTWIGLSAAVGLILWISDANDEWSFGFIALTFSFPMYGLAELVVRKYRIYRYGIEEALSLQSLSFFCVGGVLIILSLPWHPENRQMVTIAAALVSVFAFWLYLRFGFLYAALISTAALCIVPFQFSLSPLWERIFLVLILGLLFLISLQTESKMLEDFRKKRKSLIQAGLFGGIYLSVNLRIFAVAESWFDQTPLHLTPYAGLHPEAYWVSYVLTFLVPVMGLYFGTKARKRALINVAAIALALSLATNKDYLGLKHYVWDPIVFGATLILAAVFIIRWLAKGQNRERHGFTTERILNPERYGLTLAEIGAAMMPSVTTASFETPPVGPSPFEGGQSGGGGASRDF